MASECVGSSAPGPGDWHSQLLQSFRRASAHACTSAEDADLLTDLASDLADCSARECITFMLPALDRHASDDDEDDTRWSAADAALLRGFAVALPNVRSRQQQRMLGDCLNALLRRLETAVPAEAAAAASTGDAPSATAAAASANGAALSHHAQTAAADIVRDVRDFVIAAADGLKEPPECDGMPLSDAAAAAPQDTTAALARFVCKALAQLVVAAATLPDPAQPTRDSIAVADRGFGGSSAAEDPLEQAYGPSAALAAALLSTLPWLDGHSTDDLANLVFNQLSGDESAFSDEEADWDETMWRLLGHTGIIHAALCCPSVVQLRFPDDNDNCLMLAILATKKWLELASEHRSVRVALAALRLAVAAGAHMRKFVRRAGVDAGEELRLLAPQLVVLMVHHADADVRGDACRALQSFVRCLTPSAQLEVLEELLGSPYPSVATVLLQLLRELVAAALPPPPRMALDMAARWLQVEGTANAMIELGEPTAAALSLFRLLLLRAVAREDSQLTTMLAKYQLAERVRDISAAATAAMSQCGLATMGATPLNAEQHSALNAQRALERLLEVASRVDELCRRLAK